MFFFSPVRASKSVFWASLISVALLTGCPDESVTQDGGNQNKDSNNTSLADATTDTPNFDIGGGSDRLREDRAGGEDSGAFDHRIGQSDPLDPNNANKDSDCDGLSDAEEYANVYVGGGSTDPDNSDSDGDGLFDGLEVGRTSSVDPRCHFFVGDAQPSTRTNPTSADTDGDGAPDGQEDSNRDGAWQQGQELDPNHPDTDRDGLCDGPNSVPPRCTGGDSDPFSATTDSDGDGIIDSKDVAPNNPDRDNDGLCDGPGSVVGVCEGGEDLNGDGIVNAGETDPDHVDTDCDGLTDGDEVTAGLNPRRLDSDGDLISDGVEGGATSNLDPGYCNAMSVDADATTTSDGLAADSDGDGINDGVEDANQNGRLDPGETDPNDPDTDGDGLCDGPQTVGSCTAGEDLNANGRVDYGETDPRVHNSAAADGGASGEDASPHDPNNPNKDSDCDGLSDAEEYANIYVGGAQTNPSDPDSDNDGLSDGLELGRTSSPSALCTVFVGDSDSQSQTDPTQADSDGDGLIDGLEDLNLDGAVDVGQETDPNHPDTDRDSLCDGPNDVLPICLGGDPDPLAVELDSDHDGIPDTEDSAPNNPDRDGDGLCDGARDVAGVCIAGEDLNGDGVMGAGETDPDHVDTDCDGLSDLQERTLGLDPRKRDSDGDLIDDGIELGATQNLDATWCVGFVGDADPASTTDPLNRDSDGDGISDGVEDSNRDGQVDSDETDPNNADTDGDGSCDGPPTAIAGVCTGGEDVNANGVVDFGETDPRVDESTVDAGSVDVDPFDPNNPTNDSDCDGLSDATEFATIYPGGAKTDPNNPDTDNDGLPDGLELGRTSTPDVRCTAFVGDTDTTSQTDPTLNDSDGDGIYDGAEDANLDGSVQGTETDPRDPDTDDDGLCDGSIDVLPICSANDPHPLIPESQVDSDLDGIPDQIEDAVVGLDPTLADSDGDGLCDGAVAVGGTCSAGEDLNADGVVNAGETDPKHVDTDCDGLSDQEEAGLGLNPLKADTDGDLVADGVELGRTTNLDPGYCGAFVADADPATTTDPLDTDSDGDGINDGVEDANRDGNRDATETGADNEDTDGDLLCDGPNTVGTCSGGEDRNANGQLDYGETDPLVPNIDSDSDGIEDIDEATYGTLPNNPDTDGDGLEDGEEVFTYNTIPTSQDTDCDGVSDGEEISLGLDPLLPDSDSDGITDGIELQKTSNLDGARCTAFIGDADPSVGTDPGNPDTDNDGIMDGAEDANQNGQVDSGELDPNNNGDSTGPTQDACATDQLRPVTLVQRSGVPADLVLAVADDFPSQYITDVVVSGESRGAMVYSNVTEVAGFAIKATSEISGSDTTSKLAALETDLESSGNLSDKFTQTTTTWDGFDTVYASYTYTDSGNHSVGRAANDIIQAIFGTATGLLTGTALGTEDGPFHLQLELIHRSNGSTIVVLALTNKSQLESNETRLFHVDDLTNGSALAQFGDTTGVQCDRMEVAIPQEVDFIWVVDNSGSMGNEQDALATAAQQMGTQLGRTTADWRIAVLTSDADNESNNYSSWTNESYVHNAYSPKYCSFTRSTADFEDCISDVGTNGSGSERFFKPVACLMGAGGGAGYPPMVNSILHCGRSSTYAPPPIGDWSFPMLPRSATEVADKIRQDADVVFVFLSDASEQSDSGLTNISNWIAYFDNFDGLGGAHSTAFVAGIVCPAGENCSDGTVNTRWPTFFSGSGGIEAELPNDSDPDQATKIATAIEQILDLSVAQSSPYILTKPPISATIKVAIEGSTTGTCDTSDIPRSSHNGFDYDGAANAIVFYGDCRPTTIDAEIAVSYRYWTDLTADPDGGDQPGECEEPLIWVDDGCVCPHDCGQGSVPPNMVCDTVSCTLVCRQDCGTTCPGASLCDPTPGVCACDCPGDCGGAAPGPNFTCDRVTSSGTYCQWTCPGCPGSPSDPDMLCDLAICDWACPECNSCPGLSICSNSTCECECQQSLTCDAGYQWNETACDCVCDTASLNCSGYYQASAELCACVCQPDCGGACPGGGTCVESLCECMCPPDCGQSNIPPEMVCNTQSCQLECRPDCGGACPGASTCNASSCDCDCPGDCGGPPPSSNFVCQRDPALANYCEYVCDECPGSPSHQDMVCDTGTCEWTCPDCGNCPGLSTCSEETCQCECQITLTCGQGYTWDAQACDCVCDTAALGCSGNYEADADLCACVCADNCNNNCQQGWLCNPSTCDCACPPDCGQTSIPPQQVCDTQSCQLVCRSDCGGTCSGNSVCNSDPQVCACECPEDCGGTPPGDNYTCDRDPQSANYCEWVCNSCPGEPSNPLMECDLDSCTWTCPDCGTCSGYASCGELSCVCECPQGVTCDPGYTWDEISCDCVCDTTNMGCDERHTADGDLCACVCGENCNDTCEPGTACNESLCDCLPEGG